MCHKVCERVCVQESVGVQTQLGICCWTTALDLLTNYLNPVQAGASVCESHF